MYVYLESAWLPCIRTCAPYRWFDTGDTYHSAFAVRPYVRGEWRINNKNNDDDDDDGTVCNAACGVPAYGNNGMPLGMGS